MLLNNIYRDYAWEILLHTDADIVRLITISGFLMNDLNIRHWENVSRYQTETLLSRVLGLSLLKVDACYYKILVMHFIADSFNGNMRIIYEDWRIRHWQNVSWFQRETLLTSVLGLSLLIAWYKILVMLVIVGSFNGNMRIINEDCSQKTMLPMIIYNI